MYNVIEHALQESYVKKGNLCLNYLNLGKVLYMVYINYFNREHASIGILQSLPPSEKLL